MNVASSLGAITVNPKNENVRNKVMALTDGRGADVVVECVGTPEAVKFLLIVFERVGTYL